jgi:hypothetical protein
LFTQYTILVSYGKCSYHSKQNVLLTIIITFSISLEGVSLDTSPLVIIAQIASALNWKPDVRKSINYRFFIGCFGCGALASISYLNLCHIVSLCVAQPNSEILGWTNWLTTLRLSPMGQILWHGNICSWYGIGKTRDREVLLPYSL